MDFNALGIKLLSGSHPDTGTTGSGCFMNVISYLQCEEQITDDPNKVCGVIRPFMIWLNDALNDNKRQELLPFIHRAMNTETSDLSLRAYRSGLIRDYLISVRLRVHRATVSMSSAPLETIKLSLKKVDTMIMRMEQHNDLTDPIVGNFYVPMISALQELDGLIQYLPASEQRSLNNFIADSALATVDKMLPPDTTMSADFKSRAMMLVNTAAEYQLNQKQKQLKT